MIDGGVVVIWAQFACFVYYFIIELLMQLQFDDRVLQFIKLSLAHLHRLSSLAAVRIRFLHPDVGTSPSTATLRIIGSIACTTYTECGLNPIHIRQFNIAKIFGIC